ncbi:MAG: hypothetical protein J1E85_09500 [Ruminococcus sp.]|nr:hypothetical protein [Ruminococcus sp.]
MKMKVIAILLMLTLMAFLPFAVAKCGTKTKIQNTMSTADNAKYESEVDDNSQLDEDKILCGLVAALYKSDYSDETVKAITILLNNNYSLEPNKFDLSDNSVFLYTENADNSTQEIYSKIENIISSSKELLIYSDNKNVYIPYSIISNGNTVYNENYSYISPVASPWDCFSKEYDKNSECVGVSIEGLDYLCKNGMNAEEALNWYLPNCEIK